MATYRPRVHCVLTVPILGSSSEKDRQAHGANTIDIPIRVNHVTLERNDHLVADECKIVAEYQDINVDPRFLKQCTAQVWIGNQIDDVWTPTRKDFRFIGICTHASRKTAEGGLTVELELRDYTTLFLAQKPFAATGVPTLNASLRDAWARICDHVGFWDVDTGKIVSNVEALRDRLVARGNVDLDQLIGKAMPERLAKYGKAPVRKGDDAWTIWQRIIMSLGLVSWIDKNECIVTTSTELFASTEDAPAMIYGRNILECTETVDTQINNKGIMMTSYDNNTGKTIEAFYPPPGDARIKVKRIVSRRKNFNPDAPVSESYDTYEYNDITDPAVLLELARRAYDERSRQEIQGTLKTAEMYVADGKGDFWDILDLGANQCIAISIDGGSLELIKNYGSFVERKEKLIDLGYDENVADLLVRNLDSIANLEPIFHTRQITTVLEDTGDAGNFEVTITYWNKIRLSGDTDDDKAATPNRNLVQIGKDLQRIAGLIGIK